MVALLLALLHSPAPAAECAASETVCNGVDDDCDASIDEGVCGCTVAVRAGRAYLLCTAQVRWTEARDYCDARPPYHLAHISTADENTWLDAAIDGVSTSFWWFGLNDRVTEGTWLADDGSDVLYTHWQSGEPNNSSNEDCGELNRFGAGAWNDEACNGDKRFVCEASGEPVTWFADVDGDGFGDDAATVSSTDPVAGRLTSGGDCDDDDDGVHPGAPDACYDALDADCDGWNEYDCDRDGFVSSDHPGTAGGTSTGEGDCDDTDDAIVPGPDCEPDTGDTGEPDTGDTDTADTSDTDTADTDTADTADTDTGDTDTGDTADTDTDTDDTADTGGDSDTDTGGIPPIGFFTGGGCSCDATGAPAWGLLGLAALVVRRRRSPLSRSWPRRRLVVSEGAPVVRHGVP